MVLPFVALGVAIFLAWGQGVTLTDLLLAVVLYGLTGLGVTVGFHRLLTHASFTARPWLRVALAVAGSMGFQGNVIDWVAVHRRHHAFTLPFLAGWAITGTLYGGLTAFLWAGVIRVALLQHVTWSVNSLCHVIGDRPFKTRRHDRSSNVWPLALLSFGESWHNGHHSEPSCARHGLDRGQLDPSAALIGLFERLGWASSVHWPDQERFERRRVGPGKQARAPAGH
ncbi:acyl-CoA desaturase [Nonomuraea deserti]|uniref:acyl-CoA desaturase n=1 Tax=Nonomuraea deserti TaxID=1848322 RepID=UPI001FEB0C8F|nr:acyl-CoA desaturase [Nonomuraea deserti]